ncbi:MAG: ATPase, partial [Candidatus Thiodiazotropha sp.]
GQLDQVIAQEQERLDKVEKLHLVKADLQQKVDDKQRHMEICAVADQLIQGTTREVSHKFNHKLRGLVSKTLPLFTENRYEHLQIDDDLSVRAFSSEKRDFMDLDEISSGTQRQIMLAVRLALSQELVNRAIQGSQFLFLDEPFAFFDQKRTRSSLTVLPTLSEELNQIWIVAQEFAADLKFDMHVRCDRESNAISMQQS